MNSITNAALISEIQKRIQNGEIKTALIYTRIGPNPASAVELYVEDTLSGHPVVGCQFVACERDHHVSESGQP